MSKRPPVEEYLRDTKDPNIQKICLYAMTLEMALLELGKQLGKNAMQLAQEYLEQQRDIVS